MENIYRDDEFKCPYCLEIQDTSDGGPSFFDEDEWQCQSCDKKFLACYNRVFTSTMDCHLNKEAHEMVPYNGVYGDGYYWHICKKCEYEKTFESRPTETITLEAE